jgi:hypothetical protein
VLDKDLRRIKLLKQLIIRGMDLYKCYIFGLKQIFRDGRDHGFLNSKQYRIAPS